MFFVPKSRYTSTDTGPKVGPFATLNLFRAVDQPRRVVGATLGNPEDEPPSSLGKWDKVVLYGLIGLGLGLVLHGPPKPKRR